MILKVLIINGKLLWSSVTINYIIPPNKFEGSDKSECTICTGNSSEVIQQTLFSYFFLYWFVWLLYLAEQVYNIVVITGMLNLPQQQVYLYLIFLLP